MVPSRKRSPLLMTAPRKKGKAEQGGIIIIDTGTTFLLSSKKVHDSDSRSSGGQIEFCRSMVNILALARSLELRIHLVPSFG